MATRILEYYGDQPCTPKSVQNAQSNHCPYVAGKCHKKYGACSLGTINGSSIIICPNRLYDQNFSVLKEIADEVFSTSSDLVSVKDYEVRKRNNILTGNEIVVFGKHFHKELGIPSPKGFEDDDSEVGGSFKIDYILAKMDSQNKTESFVAVEVQTIDTTNSYSDAAKEYSNGNAYINSSGTDFTKAGLNWENVSKRILPQLIYKGHALRRERLCSKGMYFVVPHAVYLRIKRRIGGRILEYPKGPGTITFKTYDLSSKAIGPGYDLMAKETFTTTVEQLAFAFVSPQNLPDLGVYEGAISKSVEAMAKKPKP